LRSDRAAAPGGIAATVLASLAPLRAEALREQALDDLLDAVVVAAPAGTAQRVLAGLAPVRARERRATVVKRTLIGVAVAAAAVLLVWRWSARSEPERRAPPELVDAPVEPALEDDQELLAYALEHWDLLTDDDVDLWLASLDPVDQARNRAARGRGARRSAGGRCSGGAQAMTVGKIPAGLLLALLFASSSAVAQEPARQREPRVERQLRIDGLHRRWTGLPDGSGSGSSATSTSSTDFLRKGGTSSSSGRGRCARRNSRCARRCRASCVTSSRRSVLTKDASAGAGTCATACACAVVRCASVFPHELRERIEHGPPEARSHVRWKLERGRERMRAPELQRLARELGIDSRRVRRAAELSQAARRHVDRDLERRAEREERP
jgi:hypothetical protein